LSDRLTHLYESASMRDVIEVAILAVAIFVLLRLLGKTRGAGMVRGLGMVVVGLFLVAQVIVASLDLTVLGRVLDYLLTTVMLGLLVIFHPELRRGLMVLGRYRMLRYFVQDQEYPVADKLADAAEAMSRECVGALIVIEREQDLSSFIETGERLDAEVSCNLLRSLFSKRSPLHDGAVILSAGRIAAAGCQLPLAPPPDGATMHVGMRHRSALCMSEETDAVLLVVSEETGRISIAVAGKIEPVPRENLPVRLAGLLSAPAAPPRGEAAERRTPRSAA
jgi:diadenylate cyclase